MVYPWEARRRGALSGDHPRRTERCLATLPADDDSVPGHQRS
ncbi:hypothetical protein trd_A0903 (plasmid) [Thermomicrobium roseum DSM 5159]|uniref:Uncharacterized protein n=1 Tax=Thermomicrobium roseum (strain ATCC 27502 / DSM 5159 / P-2) TaxID=309801 RepID=B9L539_THERP|nr:hypothetical protein trd_A0903 [Thermomicrobium roseum DSM 5159]